MAGRKVLMYRLKVVHSESLLIRNGCLGDGQAAPPNAYNIIAARDMACLRS